MMNNPGLEAQAWAANEISSIAERSFFSTMEAFSSGTLATDRQGQIVWINDKYCRLLGVVAADLVGHDISSVLPGTRIPEVLATGKPIVLDVMEHDNARYVVSRFPVFDDNKNVIGAFGFILYGAENFDLLQERFTPLTASPRIPYEKGDSRRSARPQPRSFCGSSAVAHRIRLLSAKAAGSSASVLITGPTGSGKEVVAQSIHSSSARAKCDFVAVNVGAIPEALFEAEFFGTSPGAFTGADRRSRMGKLQLADGGTLFLDEIGDMPTGVQVKLLRFLETGEFEALGSNRVQCVDVRLIAATSVDLRRAVAEKRFRADLYYRLAVFPIAVPALHERTEDIAELSNLLLEQIAIKGNIALPMLLPDAVAKLQSLNWPGNVRELRNVLERCCICVKGASIDVALIDSVLEPEAIGAGEAPSETSSSLAEAVEALEREKIVAAIAASNGSFARAALSLRISRTTLYKKTRQLGLTALQN